MRTSVAGLLAAFSMAVGCFGDAAIEPVEDHAAIVFVERHTEFYALIVGVPVDASLTYEKPGLREFFATQPEYADYYSSLATQVREAQFRDGRIEVAEVVEWRFVSADLAVVDLKLRGHHERELMFWELELDRSDTWRRVGGTWLVVPDKL